MNNTWQEIITFTPDQLLIGTGWHEVEKDNETYIRWTRSEKQATIYLQPCRNVENRLNISIYAAANDKVLKSLKIQADSVPLPVYMHPDKAPAVATAVLPQDLGKKAGEATVLSLQLDGTGPDPLAKSGTKPRQVGIALHGINIFPLARPVFTAEKYTDPVPFDGWQYLLDNPGVKDSIAHGLYKSAYQHYQQYGKDNCCYIPHLHPLFDECPGDTFDILRHLATNKDQEIQAQLMQEIMILRDKVDRLGDNVRDCKTRKMDNT